MGQAESSPGGHAHGGASGGGLHDPALPANTVAFHVLRVADNSPAADAGIEPFFDFVFGINQTRLGQDIDTFTNVLEENQGRQVALMVYSTKRKEIRDVYVVPSSDWSSNGLAAGTVDDQPSLLGLSLRLCNPQHALEQVWHVLEVLEGSPAQSAGLVPFGDWIIGYAGGVLRGEGDFYDVVETHTDKPLRLFVYNSDYDVTRETILVPNRTWGGEGLLGAGVGYGLLHRIPKPKPPPHQVAHHDHGDDNTTRGLPPPPRASSASSAPPPPPVAPPPPRRTAAVSPPPPPSSSSPYNRTTTTTSATAPPPPSPATSSSRSKYIPPPPLSTTSPTRHPAPPPPRTTIVSPTNRSFPPSSSSRMMTHHEPIVDSTSISFSSGHRSGGGGGTSGEYGFSQGVEIVPSSE